MNELENRLTVLVMSCEKNRDLFDLYKHCVNKYWKDHPEIMWVINKNVNNWTNDLITTLHKVKTKYVLLTVDDTFIRTSVNSKLLNDLLNDLDKLNGITINLETSFDDTDLEINDLIKKRPINGFARTSVMCGIWNVKQYIEILNNYKNLTPWQLEDHSWDKLLDCYDFYVCNKRSPINIGHNTLHDVWGLVQGKWCRECKDFFDKEGIQVDYSIRGFYN